MARIDHLGIAVTNIDQARKFYQALGLTVLEEDTDEGDGKSIMVPLGESRLRLFQKPAPTDKEGVRHLALHVDDISGTFEQLKQAGVRLLSEEIEIGDGGRLSFFVDPGSSNGVLLEVCQDPISAV
jgi:methylmalonyl-CoA/ethylmalonyl-CoA epimerase